MPGDNAKAFPEMNDGEFNLHSFIVRVWLEETQADSRLEVWRGHITYVNDGHRHYFEDINEIPAFMVPHLKKAG